MAHSNWCGKTCSECSEGFCNVDMAIPCSPDCEAINPKTNLANINICIGCGANLIDITAEEGFNIITNRTPVGKFYCKGDGLFVGIDNEDGEAWVEEFKSQEECFRWLYEEGRE